MAEWQLINYLLEYGPDGSREVGAAHYTSTFLQLPDDADDRAIVAALKRSGWIARGVRQSSIGIDRQGDRIVFSDVRGGATDLLMFEIQRVEEDR